MSTKSDSDSTPGNDSDSEGNDSGILSRKVIPILLQENDYDSGNNCSGYLSRKMIPILLHENDSDSGEMILGLGKMILDMFPSVSFVFPLYLNKIPPIFPGALRAPEKMILGLGK